MNQNDYETATASDPDEALDVINEVKPDLIILDMNFTMETTGEEGLALLKEIKSLLPAIPVILITAWGSISLAVDGMKAGAVDFITKPWSNEFFLQSVRTALCLSKETEQKLTRNQIDSKYNFESIIGKDPVFVAALETVGRVSKTDASVLILGESGTGKELIAEAIHKNSSRKNQPFVKVNLGGISSSLFESEMFGHIKGSFTDARYDRIGRFEMANNGTIFLDEIGELDINMQVKLLRVLQDRTFEVLGSSKPRTVNVRVICATNRDLEEMVNTNEFREDLYYRINLISLKLPALRERAGDIPLLANYFIKTLQNKYKRPGLQINKQAMNWLKGLSWSGNIRELKNLVERAVVISNKDFLELDNFTKEFITGPQKITSKKLPDVGTMTLEEMEKAMILKALKENKNLSRVARILGISRAALYRRMEKFGISA